MTVGTIGVRRLMRDREHGSWYYWSTTVDARAWRLIGTIGVRRLMRAWRWVLLEYDG
jgi:hypothetical protein